MGRGIAGDVIALDQIAAVVVMMVVQTKGVSVIPKQKLGEISFQQYKNYKVGVLQVRRVIFSVCICM